MSKIEIKTATCSCGSSFEYEHDPEWNYNYNSTTCPECTEAERRQHMRNNVEAKAKQRIEDISRWLDELTPKRFLSTDITHPAFNRRAWEKIAAWTPTAVQPWLGLVGITGACKTRMSYLIARKILLARVKADNEKHKAGLDYSTNGCDSESFPRIPRIMAASAFDVRRAILKTTDFNDREGRANAQDFLEQVKHADVLILDDLGKGRFTPAVAEGFFGIIDHRHGEELTTVWTANSSPEQLAAMLPAEMQSDMGGAFAGRLIECSTIFNLK